MTLRTFLLGLALLAAFAPPAVAQSLDDTIQVPVLRAHVIVSSDVVRVGDLVDNAGTAAQIAVYRAPDLGTTGSLPVAQVLNVLSAHQVIGVTTGNIKDVSVTRLARTVSAKDIQHAVAHALEHRGGLGDAENLALTFDRELQDLYLEATNSGPLQPVAARLDPRSGRFDVIFEIANDAGAPTELRFTGTAIETVLAAVLTRDVERTEVLKASDVIVERRPKAEVGSDPAVRDRAVGMQMRRPMRAGRPLRVADLVKPDLVQRDQAVTVIYQAAGLYLTTRGKALDNGTEGDVVSVLNPQSRRTVTGVVSGRGQVTIQIVEPTPVYISDPSAISSYDTPASLADAGSSGNVTPKPE